MFLFLSPLGVSLHNSHTGVVLTNNIIHYIADLVCSDLIG